MTESKRLLVVAAAETFRRMLRFYFTKSGFEVEAVKDGEAALRFVTSNVPDLVIVDEDLPGMDGLQLVRQLRSSPITVHVPIVFLPSSAAPAREQAALAAGANEVVKRDSRVEEIGDRVAALMAGAEDSRAAGPSEARAHTVTVLSARGGSGKTMLATNLGVALAQRSGETTVLLDLNLEFGSTAMMLDLRPLYTLRDIAEASTNDISDAEFDSMLLRHSSGLRLVPAVAQPGDSELIPEGSLPRIIERLRRMYNHLVVDGRPSFREIMLDLWENSDTLLITCPPEVISVLITRSLLEAFGVINVDPEKVLIVLNQVAPKARLTKSQVERGLNHPVFVLPYGGEQLYRSVDVGKAYVLERPNEPTALAIHKLSEQLLQRRAGRPGLSARAS